MITENNQLIYNGKDILILINDLKKIWCKGKDIAKILEFTNLQKASRDHIREKYRKIMEI